MLIRRKSCNCENCGKETRFQIKTRDEIPSKMIFLKNKKILNLDHIKDSKKRSKRDFKLKFLIYKCNL